MSLSLSPKQLVLAERAFHIKGPVWLAMETGTGKTRIAITAALMGEMRGLGIVAAQGRPLLEKWKRELEEAGQTAAIIDSPKALAAYKGDTQWVLVNYSSAVSSEKVAEWLKARAAEGAFAVFILDECHYVKGDTKRMRRWRWLSHNNFEARQERHLVYMLSATPIVHSHPDLMNQFKVAGNWGEFKGLARYNINTRKVKRKLADGTIKWRTEVTKTPYDWQEDNPVQNIQGLEVARAQFKAVTLRCRKQEVFPPNILPLEQKDIFVPIGHNGTLLSKLEQIVRARKAKRLAQDAHKARKEIDAKITDPTQHAAALALQAKMEEQARIEAVHWCEVMMELLEYLLTTEVKDRDEGLVQEKAQFLFKNADMMWFQVFGIFYQAEGELIAENARGLLERSARNGNKFAVYAAFLQPLRTAAAHLKSLGVKHAFLTGEVDQDDREGIRDRFVNGDTQVLLCTYRAAAHGIEFTPHVRRVMMLQRSVAPAEMVQAENRIHRFQDTKEIVATHSVTCVGSICGTTTKLEDNLSSIIARKRNYAQEMGLGGTLS